MPDRQRHSRLSDTFARLFSARSRMSPPPAGRRRAGGPAGPQGAGPAVDQPGFTAGPLRPPDPFADTMLLGRVDWEPSDPLGHPNPQGHQTDRPDPMADTTLLSRVTLPRPTAEPAAPGSGPDSESQPDREPQPDAGAGPTPPLSVRALVERHRRRLTISAGGLAAVCVLLALPPVRSELRDSFTRLPQPYTALYFTTPPQVDGTVLTVPVSVHAVDTSTNAYSVRVWTVDAQGRVDDSRTADLTWDGQAMSTVVSMPVNPAAQNVWVSLKGSDETLHYKIAVA
ncbi:hypothetical protein ABH926_005511 [Catenulispora sp. GP43]|uniref:hypothetical protein n=1 Tax=Catenulispora sp. GP43 TaxID=3156263 RepID=UPI003518B333